MRDLDMETCSDIMIAPASCFRILSTTFTHRVGAPVISAKVHPWYLVGRTPEWFTRKSALRIVVQLTIPACCLRINDSFRSNLFSSQPNAVLTCLGGRILDRAT